MLRNFVIYLQVLVVSSASLAPIQVNTFRTALQQQNLQTILLAIEERFQHLDKIYATQYSPSIENKIEQYLKKLEAIDSKINRMEGVITLQLEKISENISVKNFKDEITKTNTYRKIESVYEGIIHKVAYVENKFETSMLKIQSKLDLISIKMDKIEDNLVTRNADIEAELADGIAAIDDLKNTCVNIESNILNINKESINKTLTSNEKTAKDGNKNLKKSIEEINKVLSNKLQTIQEIVYHNLNISNSTNYLVKTGNVQGETNEFTNKVTNMYNELWTKGVTIENYVKNIEKTLNFTKTENQNSFRALMVQIGKITPKENSPNDDSQKITQLSKKLDTNFEKLYLKQDLFLEGCYKLQLDESQMETKISAVLEKLLDIFQQKTSIQPKDLKLLEQLLKSHETNSRRNLRSIENNILQLMNQISNDKKEAHDVLSELKYQFASLDNCMLLNPSKQHETEILQGIQQNLHQINNEIQTFKTEMSRSHQNITDRMDNDLNCNSTLENSTKHIGSYVRNIYQLLKNVEESINNSYLGQTASNYKNVYSFDINNEINDLENVMGEVQADNENLGSNITESNEVALQNEQNIKQTFDNKNTTVQAKNRDVEEMVAFTDMPHSNEDVLDALYGSSEAEFTTKSDLDVERTEAALEENEYDYYTQK